jgi:hypothetical protein
MKRLMLAVVAVLVLGAPLTTHAAVITYETPAGTTLDALPASASATLTTSNGDVLVELLNSIVDPTSVIQNISGIQFTIGDATAGSLTSSSGTQRTIAGNGTFTDGPIGATDWLFSFNAGTFMLTALGASGPDQTIVGAPNASNVYQAANGSIAGNNPHNPFLGETASFSLQGVGVTDASTISNVVLFFGTESMPVPLAECTNGCGEPPTAIPEPMSMLLLGSGLVGIAWSVRKRAMSR